MTENSTERERERERGREREGGWGGENWVNVAGVNRRELTDQETP